VPRSGIGLNELLGMFCPDKNLHDLALKKQHNGNTGQWNPRIYKEPAGERQEHRDKYRESGRSLARYAEVPPTPGADGVDE